MSTFPQEGDDRTEGMMDVDGHVWMRSRSMHAGDGRRARMCRIGVDAEWRRPYGVESLVEFFGTTIHEGKSA
jgi:hypothetical protein